ncbi:MAG: sensor histidine kinase [Mycobacterium sp.]
MRHAANLLVALTMAADPLDIATPAGSLLLSAVGVWSTYRLITRSPSAVLTGVDFAFTVAVCLAVSLLVSGTDFHRSNCAPIAVAGTAVVAFTVSLPARASLPMTITIAAAYAFGSAQVVGWSHIHEIFNLYYFALQWAASYVMRFVVLRVAGAVDSARESREAAEVTETVNAKVREYDREQTRLLHDTVASTLMLAGQNIAADRLATRARRDLGVLAREPLDMHDASTELVAALRELASHNSVEVRFSGSPEIWVDGDVGAAVIAASREALTNVDRHAHAGLISVDVTDQRVTIADDGIGFDPKQRTRGFGLSASLQGRMNQLGGRAVITSRPGGGTTVELGWATTELATFRDPDRLIARTQRRFVYVMTTYAVLNVLVTAPFSVGDATVQGGLAIAAIACAVSVLPGLLNRWTPSASVGIAGLMVVAVAQTMSIPANLIGSQAHWAQGAIGWCLLPLLLKMPSSRAMTFLVVFWFTPAVVGFLRSPSMHDLANIGLGTASILTVQLCVYLIYTLLADAATAAHIETAQRVELLARERVAHALAAEYNRRYAQLIANVVPLLEELAASRPTDESFRRRARVECQRMRALFDQSANFDHPLLQRLRPAIDFAEARHIDVSVHIDGLVPELDQATVRRVADILECALQESTTSARIALSSDAEGLTASIVCQDLDDPGSLRTHPSLISDDLELTLTDTVAWLTLRCATAETRTTVAKAIDEATGTRISA